MLQPISVVKELVDQKTSRLRTVSTMTGGAAQSATQARDSVRNGFVDRDCSEIACAIGVSHLPAHYLIGL